VRKILVGAVVLFAVFVMVFRQRIFLRDPLGAVERAGVRQAGQRVYINYSNDVLVEDPAKNQFVLVQGWSKAPGVPQHLACFTGLACWTDGDRAAVFPLDGSGKGKPAEMSAREVAFDDGPGGAMRVKLR
jgi:hypothetical protein